MSVTGIVAALTAEARTLGPVRSQTGNATSGEFPIHTLPDGNLLVISGIGPEAAAAAAQVLAGAGVRALLSFGLAGALDPALRAGALLLPQAVTDAAGVRHSTCEPWRVRLAVRADGTMTHGGTLLSVVQPLGSPAAKSAAWQQTRAAAVDMESFAVAAVAAQANLDFAIARVVVDTAFDHLPDSVTRATGARGEIHYARLIAGLACAPMDLLALLRLSRRYRTAMSALRRLAQRDVSYP